MSKMYHKGDGERLYKTSLQFDAKDIEKLYFAIVYQAFNDLFSRDLYIKNDAFLFFNKNTFGLSDFVLDRIKKEYEKSSGKKWQVE